MSKKIQPKFVARFRKHLSKVIEQNFKLEESPVAYWTIETFRFSEKWEFQPDDDDCYDFYDLFQIVSDEFLIEEEGHGSFFVSRKYFAIRLKDTEHLFPIVVGARPWLARTKKAAQAKIRREFLPAHRGLYEVILWEPEA